MTRLRYRVSSELQYSVNDFIHNRRMGRRLIRYIRNSISSGAGRFSMITSVKQGLGRCATHDQSRVHTDK